MYLVPGTNRWSQNVHNLVWLTLPCASALKWAWRTKGWVLCFVPGWGTVYQDIHTSFFFSFVLFCFDMCCRRKSDSVLQLKNKAAQMFVSASKLSAVPINSDNNSLQDS